MKFKDAEPLEFGRGDVPFRAAWLVPESDRINICAAFNYKDALALRDWLNRVLDSYPAREGYVMIPKIPTVAMRIPWHRQGGLRHASFYQKWKAMLAAAAPAQDEQGEEP